MDEPAPPTDLATEVTAVRAAMAVAFGGYSQFSAEDVAKAISGHYRSNGRLSRWPIGEVLAESARQEAERWEEQGADEEEELKRLSAATLAPLAVQLYRVAERLSVTLADALRPIVASLNDIDPHVLAALASASAHPADLQAIASVPPLATALPPEADDD